ncbi:MAG: hypothetical protein C0391_08180 [Anaerolinea sp.]|nr:hypothetical protein [Anaerolinea sp.]
MLKFVLQGLIILAVLMTTSACATNKTIEVSAESNGSRVEMQTGDTLVITLEGNITTGYQWELLPNNEGVMQLQGDPEYVQKSAGNLKGAGGVCHFTLKAMQPGSTRVELKYYRSFEPDMAPLETFSLDVVVK